MVNQALFGFVSVADVFRFCDQKKNMTRLENLKLLIRHKCFLLYENLLMVCINFVQTHRSNMHTVSCSSFTNYFNYFSSKFSRSSEFFINLGEIFSHYIVISVAYSVLKLYCLTCILRIDVILWKELIDRVCYANFTYMYNFFYVSIVIYVCGKLRLLHWNASNVIF